VKAKALLVDDEPQVLEARERLLRRDGYDLRKAGGGEAALELPSRHEVAVMLCDERMPGMAGTDVPSEARSLSPDTVRTAFTACGSVETLRSLAGNTLDQNLVNLFLESVVMAESRAGL
jgi:response regulator RpfG family c-di-GMP phosphodiesterase